MAARLTAQEWEREIGARVHAAMASADMARYFAVWVNDDRRLLEQGGGLSRRDGLRWIRDFGYKWEEMPNFAAHAVADEKHSDLFVPLLEQYAPESERALKAADDALELFKLYHLGVAEEMEKAA